MRNALVLPLYLKWIEITPFPQEKERKRESEGKKNEKWLIERTSNIDVLDGQ